ncbi:MAG: hypothetical protein IKP72_06285 [Clostridia bacterium]|nr:hypothetical protein [Clostridia bacterium]
MDGSGKGKKHSSVEELKMMTAEQLQADGYRLATREQQIKTEQETMEKEIERQQSKLDEQKKAVIDKYTDAEEKDRHARNTLSECKQVEDTLRNLCCALTGKPIDSQMDTQTLVMRSMRDFRQIAEEKQPGFPCFHVGKRILVNREMLQAWLDDQCSQPA